MISVVPTDSATAASSWLLMPNNGQSELIPPSGSVTPCNRNQPHAATTAAEAISVEGYQDVRRIGAQTYPANSWNMNRPTRVPVSTVVRMKSASNMIAKWYQRAVSDGPNAPEKICAIPTARDGAPPVRASRVFSPTAAASSSIWPGARVNPQPRMVVMAWVTSPPSEASGAFIAK